MLGSRHESMKSITLLTFITLFAGMIFSATSACAAEIGKSAPDFTLTDVKGITHHLSDFRGKTVVLEWVNQECPFVVKHYESGNIPKLQSDALADGVIWLSINSARRGAQGDYSPEEVKVWQQKNGSSSTAYFRDTDGWVGRLYGAKTTPHMYVITADGTLVYNGAIDSIRSADPSDISKAENYVRSALQAVATGEPVTTPSSRPYGCAVKY